LGQRLRLVNAEEIMKIQISKQTPLAMAPDAICEAINRHTEHTAFMSNEMDTDADVLHFNNTYWLQDKPATIHYHSEPRWKGLQLDCPYLKLVNAQYHALLPEYQNCIPVRQVINFDNPAYDMRLSAPGTVKFGYSPTARTKVGEWHDKGYDQTVKVLQELKSGCGWDYDVIEGVSLEECISRKQNCSIIIDECVTGSYHRSGLEGLALGKPTVSYLSKEVGELFISASGRHGIPFVNVPIAGLKDGLVRLVEALNRNPHAGFNNRLWMARYWNPADIVQEYVKIYEGVLDAK